MTQFLLNIELSVQAVQQLSASGQSITLIKEVEDPTGTPVIWVAFRPLEMNTVQWRDEIGIYSSNSPIQNGVIVTMMSQVFPAQPGFTYPLESNGAFGPPSPGPGSGTYGVSNQFSNALTFGLVQPVAANGSNLPPMPQNASLVPPHQMIAFTPTERLQAFVQGFAQSSTILDQVPSNALTVDMTGETETTIHYDDTTGRFEPGPMH